MGFKRDKEKERLKKHRRDQKLAKTRRKIGTLTIKHVDANSANIAMSIAQDLSIGHLRRIVNNPARFSSWPDLCRASVDIYAEKVLQLERER